MSEPQLERSVLEAKEREELFAIAEALGTHPTSRARKGDLVNAILRATGVEVGPEPESPRRPRTRRTTAKPAAESASASAESGNAEPGGQGAEGSVAPVDAAANGTGEGSEAAESGRLPFDTDEPSATRSGERDPGDTVPGDSAAGTAETAPAASGSTGPAGGRGPGPAGGTTLPANGNGGVSPAPGRPAGAPRPPRPPRTGYIASPDGGTTGSVPSSARGRAGGAEPYRGGSDQPDGRPASAPPARPPAPAGRTGSEPGAGSAASPVPATSAGSVPSVTVPAGEAQAGGGADPAAPAASSSGESGEPRQRADGETGNRRNRRRRGRDRGERNVERDLPSQNTDAPYSGEPLPVSGYLDLRDEGYGFLRTQGYVASQADVYVSISQVRRFSLRKGDWLEGASRPAAATEKYPALLRIDTVGGLSPDDARSRRSFDDLVAVPPTERIPLERDEDPTATDVRLIDLFAPLARGQRAILAGPPRSGKTGVLVDIITSLEAAHSELQLLVLVVDERPEEVTELRRAIRSDVVATTFDRPAEEHVQVAELVIERAKRMVEGGADVVIVADGLTRLARAYNLVPSGSSRVLPGGIDAGAVQRPLGLFAAGRNIEDGGSLTLLATALVDTGSRLDEVVYEEMTAAANMQVRLDRELVRRNVRPAIDIEGSWSRNDDRLLDSGTLERVRTLRLRVEDGPTSAVEDLLERLGKTKSNQEFLTEVASEQPSGA